MPQSLANLFVHVIFSTKNRENLIAPEIEAELYAYIGGIVTHQQSKLIAAGGIENHAHLLISISKNIAVSNLVGDIKRNSSKWIKTKAAKYARFGWQDGYAVFSVSQSNVETVKRYIARQKEKHYKLSFEDEARRFFRKHEMDFDERYVWD